MDDKDGDNDLDLFDFNRDRDDEDFIFYSFLEMPTLSNFYKLLFKNSLLCISMSGYATYDVDPSTIPLCKVPVVKASEETLKGYGVFIPRFDPAAIEIVPWPRPFDASRPLMDGTGLYFRL